VRQTARQLAIDHDNLKAAFQQCLPPLERRVGWQPSRFLTDRGEAERAYALAERLGSVNAAAAELGTTWPSLPKAFQCTASACRSATPSPCVSAPSTRPASAAASRPGGVWTGCLCPQLWRPPGSGRFTGRAE
jgi:hypothetical protein